MVTVFDADGTPIAHTGEQRRLGGGYSDLPTREVVGDNTCGAIAYFIANIGPT